MQLPSTWSVHCGSGSLHAADPPPPVAVAEELEELVLVALVVPNPPQTDSHAACTIVRQCTSHCVVQQYVSSVHTAATHGSQVGLSGSPVLHSSWVHGGAPPEPPEPVDVTPEPPEPV